MYEILRMNFYSFCLFFFQIGAINGSYEERVGLLRNGKINEGKLKFYRVATALGYLEYLLNPHESPFSVFLSRI